MALTASMVRPELPGCMSARGMSRRKYDLHDGSRGPLIPQWWRGNPCHTSPPPTQRMRGLRATKVLCLGEQRFYHRKEELRALSDRLNTKPSSITVLLGSNSTGKTAMLTQYATSVQQERMVIDLDGRFYDIRNPDELARGLYCAALKNGREPWTSTLRSAYPPREEPKDGSISALQVHLQAYEATSLLESSIGRPPVLIINCSNELGKWDTVHDDDMGRLLEFFASITQVKGLCHIVLETYDYAFVHWLENRMKPGLLETFVLGELSEEHARDMLNQELLRKEYEEVDDAAWAKIHAVCGGHPHALSFCLGSYRGSDWDEALVTLWNMPRLAMDLRYLKAGYGYTPEHFATIALDLLQSPHHAIRASELEEKLGGGVQGKAVLLALVKRDLIACRPYSEWATDIPKEAYGEKLETVVTAFNPVSLYCMRLLEDEFIKILKPKMRMPWASA